MRVSSLSLATLFLLIGASTGLAQQLREDSYRWYFGANAGVTLFESQTQTRSAVPFGGAHALIMAKRAALMIGVEEAFGSDEESAYGDPDAPNGTRFVRFDRLRKYSATLLAFPLRGTQVDPYLGLGFGILHTVGTHLPDSEIFTSPTDAAIAQSVARDLGSSGFMSLVGGIQGRLSPGTVLFGQIQVTTSPSSGSLLVGPSHTFSAGVRFSLGGAKEGIRGGGY